MSVESSRSLRQSIVKTLPIALACTSSLALPGLAQSAHVGRGTVHFCSDLKTQKIGSAQIGLPTRGAVVHSAHHVKGAGSGYCRVLGSIVSVDPAADPIRFEVNLPETWNGKAVQFGGGGFDGWLHQSDGRRYTVLGDKTQPTPLAQGYATFGDSGHHHHYLFLPDELNILRSKFALNDEERNNFASDGLKKTHDVAVALMGARYGASPQRMYFVGGSTGGREAMKVVDRWPADYDGVLAAYAAWNQIEADFQFIRVTQAMYAKGRDGQSGWLPPSKTKLLRDAVLEVCDAQDGLKDKIVSNPTGCSFDPASLRCPDGKDRKGCLSEGQERTVSAFFHTADHQLRRRKRHGSRAGLQRSSRRGSGRQHGMVPSSIQTGYSVAQLSLLRLW